ncbi:MAG: hypothetical protein K2X71_23245 [Methylobacterium sp.]|uniref:hypothetical protein n=1 Tax=Methylobacterium sp. TaxID=409 RepID=UPI002584AE49|nr:hypothetical protein [Methylobacterium sp.]MBY0298911.1 hypothetical protein [Methylobacterium sp.]
MALPLLLESRQQIELHRPIQKLLASLADGQPYRPLARIPGALPVLGRFMG